MVAKVQDIETIDRFLQWVSKTPTCWLWNGYIKPNGYVGFYPGGGKHVPKVYAHRWSYEYFIGPIPDGMEVDHLCNVRHCVNPAHLEVVTRRTNLDRRNEVNGWERMSTGPRVRVLKTHCKQGHPYDDENTYWHGGYRHCRTCRRAASARRYAA